jgi:cytochrome P450
MTIVDEVAAAAGALLGSLNQADPYPAYARLRALVPVCVSPAGPVLVTSYAGVAAVLRSPLAHKDSDARLAATGLPDWRDHPALRLMFTSILQLDDPDHARLRGLVSRVFTPRRVATMRPVIHDISARLVESLRGRGSEPIDLIEEWALPLPIEVIGDLLGVPAADRSTFATLVHDFGLALEPALGPEELRRCNAAAVGLSDYFRELIAERRRAPAEDLTSALVALELTEDERITMLILLFAAGFETTTQLLAKSVVALVSAPGELERWRGDPGLTGNAVEELLRFDSPVQMNSRILPADVPVGDDVIPGGRIVFCCLGAANRDPDRFVDPDRLDLSRPDVRSMSFGGGAHFCLGAALARVEAAEALPMLFDAFDVTVAGTPVQRPGLALHGFARLPVTLIPRVDQFGTT